MAEKMGSDPLSKHFRLTEIQKKGLERIGVKTIRDLLFYFPVKYSDLGEVKQIKDVIAGEKVTLFGKILNPKTRKGWKSKIPMGEAELEDLTGKIKIIWFHQAYLAKMIHSGQKVKVTGSITNGKHGLYLSNPEFEVTDDLPPPKESLFKDSVMEGLVRFPIYSETKGITSSWIYHHIEKILRTGIVQKMEDYIPAEILKKYNLPSLSTAIVWIHMPKTEDNSLAARKRFAFEEIFFIQLRRKMEREEYEKNKSYLINVDTKDIQKFVDRFPFKATNAQMNAVDSILSDFQKEHPMARLLEGDVGSGKTAVAAVAAYATIKNRPLDKERAKQQSFGNLQVAYMAPTEILATQHFESFIKYFSHMNINIGLITGSGCKKFPSKVSASESTNISRAQLLKWIDNGEIPIVVGTHALIQKTVTFRDLALVIIDEQHRFGSLQRAKLVKKESGGINSAPHFLSMTATPIPRTLALTLYGDLDLTLLDEMPPGRKKVITEIVMPEKRDEAYDVIKSEMEKGRQLYVICPRINEPDPDKELALNVKSVVSEAERLKEKVFKDKKIGILHSKMTKDEKEKAMSLFERHETDILVATSVVEVGVNVPNATMIIIEGAERFGLSQLHQLRGRVIRSEHQAYCFVFAETKSKKTIDRLKALTTAKNGFELSEMDLALRGSGELLGKKQWGVSDLGMEAIKNIKMVEAARTETALIIEKDPNLSKHKELKIIMEEKTSAIHFE